jgi:hypothetical protein
MRRKRAAALVPVPVASTAGRSAAPAAASPAICKAAALPTTVAAIATPAEAASIILPFWPGPGRPDGFRQRFHFGRHNHDLADRSFTHALTADVSFAAQSEVNDSPLAAVHWAEVEGDSCLLHPLRRRRGAHTEFLNAEHAAVIRVETDARMFFRSHAQSFHGEMFQRQKELCLIFEKQIHVRPCETHHEVWILKLGMRRFALSDREIQIERRHFQNRLEELSDARAGFGHRIFSRQDLWFLFSACLDSADPTSSYWGPPWRAQRLAPA